MPQATLLWSLWQRLLRPFASAFTRPGHRRFVEWVTALALNVEERTITQSVVAIERTADWKAMESFAEYGAWKADAVARSLSRLIDDAPGRTWHGFRISAVDDTKVHRSGEHVWGTCTFHEYTARCPNRATTVRAHNWVCLGVLLRNDGKPAWYLPVSGRLYFRKSQLPARSGAAGPKEPFRTKCELAVELLREQARACEGAHLGVFDGGYALKNVVRPLVMPEEGSPRIDFLTRLRHDARLHALPPAKRPKGKRGRNPKWGRKLAPPRQGGRWPGPWQKGEAFIYGRGVRPVDRIYPPAEPSPMMERTSFPSCRGDHGEGPTAGGGVGDVDRPMAAERPQFAGVLPAAWTQPGHHAELGLQTHAPTRPRASQKSGPPDRYTPSGLTPSS